MNDSKALTVSKLAEQVGGRVFGDGTLSINHVASLETAGEGEIAYVEDEKLFEAAKASQASCLLIPEKFASVALQNQDEQARTLIEVERPKLAFALIAKL